MSAIQSLPCYLNGEFTTLDKANISVMDRGFIFGDGIYEVVPVYGGRPFRFSEHMGRLRDEAAIPFAAFGRRSQAAGSRQAASP